MWELSGAGRCLVSVHRKEEARGNPGRLRLCENVCAGVTGAVGICEPGLGRWAFGCWFRSDVTGNSHVHSQAIRRNSARREGPVRSRARPSASGPECSAHGLLCAFLGGGTLTRCPGDLPPTASISVFPCGIHVLRCSERRCSWPRFFLLVSSLNLSPPPNLLSWWLRR